MRLQISIVYQGNIVWTSPFLPGGSISYKSFKRKGEGLTWSQFWDGGCWGRWGWNVSGRVQVLHKSKLKSEIFNEKKKFINKNVFLCQFKLRVWLLLKDGMGIKDKKILYILGVHWKIWFLGLVLKKKTIYRGECLKKGGLGEFADLRGGLVKKGVMFLRGIDNQIYVMGNWTID